VETAADGSCAVLRCEDGTTHRFPHAVVATGGFYIDKNLAGELCMYRNTLLSVYPPCLNPSADAKAAGGSGGTDACAPWCTTKQAC
jgi:hypothetical protein